MGLNISVLIKYIVLLLKLLYQKIFRGGYRIFLQLSKSHYFRVELKYISVPGLKIYDPIRRRQETRLQTESRLVLAG